MKIIEHDTIQEVYKELIDNLRVSPTVNNTKEINNCCLVVNNPSIENFYLPYRSVSEKYVNAELRWYWNGDNRCETIGQYAKMWLNITDDGVTNNSAYGYILEKKYDYNQIEQIIELLKKDRYSRRAILNISDPTLNKIETKDLQCTIAIQFIIRDDKLEETVYMRSNDVYFGLPYDYVYFITLGNYIAERLNIKLGKYTHNATSMHMYLRDIDKFNNEEQSAINIEIDEAMKEYRRVYEK